MRRQLNEYGADIGKLDNYAPQSHDSLKMRKAGAPEIRAGSLSEGQGYFLVFAAGSSLIRMFRNLIPAPCPSSPMCPEALKSPGWFLWSTV